MKGLHEHGFEDLKKRGQVQGRWVSARLEKILFEPDWGDLIPTDLADSRSELRPRCAVHIKYKGYDRGAPG